MPVFAFPAEAGTHLPTSERWKAELAWGLVHPSFTTFQTLTHNAFLFPSNENISSTLIRDNPLTSYKSSIRLCLFLRYSRVHNPKHLFTLHINIIINIILVNLR